MSFKLKVTPEQRQVLVNITSVRQLIRRGKDSIQAQLQSASVTCNKQSHIIYD